MKALEGTQEKALVVGVFFVIVKTGGSKSDLHLSPLVSALLLLLVSAAVDDHADSHDGGDAQPEAHQHELVKLSFLETLLVYQLLVQEILLA